MAQTSTIKVLDSFQVSPPTSTVPPISMPLNYLDLPWFQCSSVERLFFYEFRHPTLYFREITLPMLKRSLSLTLQYFYPYAANIVCPQPPGEPYIHYKESDFINLKVAESDADFDHVVANYPRPVGLLRPFVPQLPPAQVTEDGIRMLPIMAIQITVFPNSGICIGLIYCHAVGDGKSFMHFMRSWTSVYRCGGDLKCLENSLPLMKRDVIKDPGGQQMNILKNYWDWITSYSENSVPQIHDVASASDKVRATFVMSRAHAEKLKHLVTSQSGNRVDSEQYHISTFVVTTAFIWVGLMKSKERVSKKSSHHDDDDDDDDDGQFYYYLFAFDGRNRLEFPVPTTYFGNCLKPTLVDVKKSELIGANGIILAAKAIGSKIKETERSGLGGVEHWASDIRERFRTGRLTPAAGAPKLRVYDTDFGWGRPRKVELAHIENDGAAAMAETRDGQGGIEVGLALDKDLMDEFITTFEQTLKLL